MGGFVSRCLDGSGKLAHTLSGTNLWNTTCINKGVTMAKMYPAQVSPFTTSSAERLLFTELQKQLSTDYVVMHSVGWLTRRRQFDDVGEADFVITNPRRGVLILEVKGGAIRGEWASENWTSTDRGGTAHEIKNPIKQADRTKWALRAKLADNPPTKAFVYPMFRGVAFPDMLLGNQPIGIDWDRQLVIDSSDLNSLAKAIDRMFSVDLPTNPLAKDAVEGLVSLLQPTVEITRPGLVSELKTAEGHMARLSEEQSRTLEVLQFQRQAVINGCAGSGKTMLAVEKAMRLAEEGFEVLLTCYNKNLAAWMRSIVQQHSGAAADRIRVSHYHDLAVKLCEEAGMPTTVRPGDQSFWDDDLPNDLADAIPLLAKRFDAIVVDEGQDFLENWWITVQELLSDPKDGVFYIFQDERQAIYQRCSNLPISAPPFSLNRNYRNSSTIHERVVDYYDGEPKPGSLGPQGRPIEFIDAAGASGQGSLRKAIATLVNEEHVQPGQIVILTPHGKDRSSLVEGQAMGNLTLTWATDPTEHQVRVSSIHSFKGLESDIVILVETDHLGNPARARRLCYVGLSRAKHHLVVIGNVPSID
jgi:hypothetical protein